MQNTKKKRRFSVVYRRSTHDKRKYGTNPYRPHFLDIFYAEHGRPDEETRSRVHIDTKGRYSYEPSMRYKALRRLERMKMDRRRSNEGTVQGRLF